MNILAEVVEKYPKSINLISNFLIQNMNLQILGWLTRLPESASQYAQRLLSINHKDKVSPKEIKKIADDFVKSYKDHGFVIDAEEAKNIFGEKMSEYLIEVNTLLIDRIEQFDSDVSLITRLINHLWTRDIPQFNLQIDIVGEPECSIFTTSL